MLTEKNNINIRMSFTSKSAKTNIIWRSIFSLCTLGVNNNLHVKQRLLLDNHESFLQKKKTIMNLKMQNLLKFSKEKIVKKWLPSTVVSPKR